jgi:hypothetical protein
MVNRRSRSALFLMEQLIVVAVFAVCAAACVRILTESYFIASETRDISNAIHAAESGAECFKAVSGDIEKVAEILGGKTIRVDGDAVAIVYYDRNWRVCNEEDAVYRLRLISETPESEPRSLLTGELSVEKLTGEVIVSLMVAARGGTT